AAGIIGGPQVAHSPGLVVYPRLFASLSGDQPRSYCPLVTQSLSAAEPLLRALDLVALSVTMPLKAQAAQYGRGDDLVARLGAANSWRRDGTGWGATNTDVIGVAAPLGAYPHGDRMLVRGAGGAAAAAAEAGLRLGMQVAVSARRAEAARTLATRLSITAVPWEARGRTGPNTLINATPVCGPDASPWPDRGEATPRVVFDLALGPPEAVPKLRAQLPEATFIDPRQMWFAQGAAQMSWMLGLPVEAAALRDAYEAGSATPGTGS
ncbi:MAG: hypothetical protein AAGA56_27290, partial [Myxococcota bacterium]